MKLISKEKNQVRIGCLATQCKASLNCKSSKIIKQLISMIEGLQSLLASTIQKIFRTSKQTIQEVPAKNPQA